VHHGVFRYAFYARYAGAMQTNGALAADDAEGADKRDTQLLSVSSAQVLGCGLLLQINLFNILSTLEWGGAGNDCHGLAFRNSFPLLMLDRRSDGKAWLAEG
jgi:hypothetical protein